MDQIPGIIFYALVSFVVPVALARFLIRADWKTVRNACMIWYGFLFLGFAGFKSAEHFGWVLIFAMFFSILTVPILALLIKLWKLMGNQTRAGAVPTAAQPRLTRFPFPRMSPLQWAVAALLGVGIILFVFWQDRADLNGRAAVLRSFFSLPVDIQFTEIHRISKSPVQKPRLAAIVQFTTPQLENFARQTQNALPWPLDHVMYDGAPLELPASEGAKWKDFRSRRWSAAVSCDGSDHPQSRSTISGVDAGFAFRSATCRGMGLPTAPSRATWLVTALRLDRRRVPATSWPGRWISMPERCT